MKRSDLVKIFGSQAAIARELGLTRAAVNHWGDEHVPELHQYRLREKRPSIDREILFLREQEAQRRRKPATNRSA